MPWQPVSFDVTIGPSVLASVDDSIVVTVKLQGQADEQWGAVLRRDHALPLGVIDLRLRSSDILGSEAELTVDRGAEVGPILDWLVEAVQASTATRTAMLVERDAEVRRLKDEIHRWGDKRRFPRIIPG
ncbi:MAG: hypothetical protein ABR511_08000 [Acidimicrobiales bacterium]